MSKEMALIVLGLFVAVLSQLGFPDGIKIVLYALAGVAIAIIGFLLRGKVLSEGHEVSESRPTAIPALEPESAE